VDGLQAAVNKEAVEDNGRSGHWADSWGWGCRGLRVCCVCFHKTSKSCYIGFTFSLTW
jgi:hypothetical protein